MKIIKSSLTIALIGLLLTSNAQSTYRMDTTTSGKPMLFGQVTKDAFLLEPFEEWFNKEYSEYQPNSDLSMNKLSQYDITLYMGTWCGDSRKEVPRVIKTLENLNYDMDKLTIHTLNQLKQAAGREELGNNIHRVPTIILTKNGKEQGRIVEHPVNTIEEDLLVIASGKKYKSNYHGLNILHDQIVKKGFDVIESKALHKKLSKTIKEDYELSKYGAIYLRNDEAEKAFAIYDLNERLFPESYRPSYSRGASYYKLGELEKAKLHFNKVLEIDPDHNYAKRYLDAIEEALQRDDMARK